ncbi:MAG: AMP-binding protein [Candidatus Cloacimonetes bacterium]|nr:AMP-binding protein [Candidatus Cloacimonadota bacterium]
MISTKLYQYVENSVRKNWELPALTNFRGETLTYEGLADRILFLHYIFQKLGLKKDDKISILGKNSINWAVTYLAIVSYGAVVVPILPDFKASDVHHIVNHSDSLVLFSLGSLYENLDAKKMQNLIAIFSLDDFSIFSIKKKGNEDILKNARTNYLEKYRGILNRNNFKLTNIENNSLASLVYTSGTTGFSKGVMLSHNSLAANIDFALRHMPLKPGDKIVSFLPIAHVFGCVFEFLFPIASGCHITFLAKIPSPKIIMTAFQEVHPRLILSVPLVIEKIYRKQIKPVLSKPLMKILLKIPLMRNKIHAKINNKLNHVFGGNFTEIVIGGAALNEEVETFLKTIRFKYTVGYGMTECAPLISYTGWQDFRMKSTGQIVDTMEVKINSSDPYKEIGEILVRGENVMNGYYKNEEATREALDKEGWLHTGDLGLIDRDNFIFIKGRSKSMILGSSGQNIYPEEIESKLNNLPYIQESIVIKRQSQLIALVYPDLESVDAGQISENQLEEIMQKNKSLLNTDMPAYMKINKIEIYPEEFEKTPKKSIKRFLYNTPVD